MARWKMMPFSLGCQKWRDATWIWGCPERKFGASCSKPGCNMFESQGTPCISSWSPTSFGLETNQNTLSEERSSETTIFSRHSFVFGIEPSGFFVFAGVSFVFQVYPSPSNYETWLFCADIFFWVGRCVCSPIPKSKGRKWKGPLASRINAIYFHQNIEISPRAGLLVSKALTTLVIFSWFFG